MAGDIWNREGITNYLKNELIPHIFEYFPRGIYFVDHKTVLGAALVFILMNIKSQQYLIELYNEK